MKTDYTIKGLILISVFLFLNLFANATKFVIQVSNFQFNPASITNVLVGDTIHWEWVDGSHTTTSTTIPGSAATWDQPINSTSTSFEYKVTVAGTYNYKCTPHFASGMVGSFIASIAGIGETSPSPSISIYPDPVKSLATISYQSHGSTLLFIKIYNVTGKLILERKIENPSPNFILDLDLSILNPGLYLATFIDNRNIFITRRVVKL